MESRKGALEALIVFWQTAGAGSKIAAAAFGLAAIILIGVMIKVATQPSFAPVYSNLRQEDAAQIAGKLTDAKIPYRVSHGGATLEVPADKIYNVRLEMAKQGLPKGGNVGYEIFDNNRIGLTEFGEHINYQRALQGELERTIAELDSVESARVHLALPEESLFSERERKPSASVVLRLNTSGQSLTAQEIRGITHLVASGVERLAPEDVRVLDSSGKMLSSAAALGLAGGDGEVLARLQMKRDFEMQLEQKVQSMLEEVAGEGKTIVRISANLDFDKREMEQSSYAPGAENGVLESQQEMRETYTGSKGQSSSQQGTPGVGSNAVRNPMVAGSVSSGADSYEKIETNNRYQVNKIVEHSVVAPGQIKGLSMALFVDEAMGEMEIGKIEKAAAAAAGMDFKRGDEIVVESLSFASAESEEAKDKKTGTSPLKGIYLSIGKDLAAILLLVVFLFFAKSLFKSAGNFHPAPAQPELAPALAASDGTEVAAVLPTGGNVPVPGNGNPDAALNNVDAEKMAQAIRALMSEPGEG